MYIFVVLKWNKEQQSKKAFEDIIRVQEIPNFISYNG